jgi:hypothetical protein
MTEDKTWIVAEKRDQTARKKHYAMYLKENVKHPTTKIRHMMVLELLIHISL